MSVKVMLESDTVPVVLRATVRCVPPALDLNACVVEPRVRTPLTVLLPLNVTVLGPLIVTLPLKVFELLSATVPVLVIVRLLKVSPAPEKVGLAPVRIIVEPVPAWRVVPVVSLQTVLLVPVRVIVLLLIVRTALAEPDAVNAPIVRVNPFVFSVPAVWVIVVEVVAGTNGVPVRSQDPPSPLKVIALIVLPAKSTVCCVALVEAKTMDDPEAAL